MICWRITTDTVDYQADDASGQGAKLVGGRWNRVGTPVLYAAESRALAGLETWIHINTLGLPLNRYLVELTVPDPIWRRRQILTWADAETNYVGWDAIPAGQVSHQYGDSWLKKGASAVLVVPSVVVPDESVILVNPAHSDASDITLKKVRKWLYDPRIAKA